MKIAVFFLIVGLFTFFESSNGEGCQMKPLDKSKIVYHVRCMKELAEKLETLKTSPKDEKKLREHCIVEGVLRQLTALGVDIGCNTEQIFNLLGLSNKVLALLQAGNIAELLAIIDLHSLVSSTVLVVEGAFSKAGLLLKDLLTKECQIMNVPLKLLDNLHLHNLLAEVIHLVSGLFGRNGLLSVLGSVVSKH
ncbi:uncharacterized protein PAF06_011456 [Gastrophryne carolinensis]